MCASTGRRRSRSSIEQPHYAGAGHAPFRPFGEAIENLAPSGSLARLADRQHLLAELNRVQRQLDRAGAASGTRPFSGAGAAR